MPRPTRRVSQLQAADRATRPSHVPRTDDDFSSYRELGISSPEHFREVAEALERFRRGEAVTFRMEEVFAESEMVDSLRGSSSQVTEGIGPINASSDRTLH